MAHDSDGRTINVSTVGTKPSTKKQPNDTFDYIFDYTTWLEASDTVASAVASVNPVNGASPTIGSPTHTPTTVTVRVSAGTDGYLGDVTCAATMTSGEVKEAEFELVIQEVGF